MKNKIYILTEVFPPSFAATGQLIEELSDSLSSFFDIEVITAFKDESDRDKDRKYRVKRININRLDKNKKSGRVINGLKFMFLSFFYLLFKSNKSLLFFVSNPPYMAFIGFIFRIIKAQKYIYLIHDQYPEIAVSLGYIKEKSLIDIIWKIFNSLILSLW